MRLSTLSSTNGTTQRAERYWSPDYIQHRAHIAPGREGLFNSVPNYEHTLVWVNPTTPDLREEQRFDRYPDSVVPGPGGTSLHFVTFPPSSVFADPSFDGEAARSEALIRLRGLADHFEKEDPAMHKTNTVDYALVYEGRFGSSLMTPRPFISSTVMSSCKTVHATRGETKARSR